MSQAACIRLANDKTSQPRAYLALSKTQCADYNETAYRRGTWKRLLPRFSVVKCLSKFQKMVSSDRFPSRRIECDAGRKANNLDCQGKHYNCLQNLFYFVH